MTKITSYSLFGNRLFYWQFLPSLVLAHHNIFPEWRLRIYVDSTIQSKRSRVLKLFEAEELVEIRYVEENVAICRSMLWRMLPIWEPEVDYVICRDVDSLPMAKDRLMVEEFISSGMAVHAINDNQAHTAPLMGGMCGFSVKRFLQLTGYSTWEEMVTLRDDLDHSQGGMDQTLLYYHVWQKTFPEICEHRLSGMAPQGCKASFTRVPQFIISDVSSEVMAFADKLAPYVGAAGYNVNNACAFFERNGRQIIKQKVLAAIEAAKDTVVISSIEPTKVALMACNENETYDFFLPLTASLWAQRGYCPYVILVSNSQFQGHPRLKLVLKKLHELNAKVMFLPEIQGFKSHNVAQVSRLYAGLLDLQDPTLVLTTDCDMWPLSTTVWADDDPQFTIWNFDKCDGLFICYCRGTVAAWREAMQLKFGAPLGRALQAQLEAGIGRNSENWGYDEALLNHRLKVDWNKFDKVRVFKRLIDPVTSLPRGRIDRADWTTSLNRNEQNTWVDAHLIRPGWIPEYWQRLRQVYAKVNPACLTWADEYQEQYLNLIR